MLQERNLNIRSQMKEELHHRKWENNQKKAEEAERIKREKAEGSNFKNLQKEQEHLKNASLKQMVKTHEQELEEKKRLLAQERREKSRQDVINKILQENEKRVEIEGQVARLEQEELELIQKLQNTQVLQKSAYEDLEGALNGEVSQGM